MKYIRVSIELVNINIYILCYIHIYIYPRGGGFTDGSGVYLLPLGVYRGCGWGGGGDVTVLATCTHGRCYVTGGVGG